MTLIGGFGRIGAFRKLTGRIATNVVILALASYLLENPSTEFLAVMLPIKSKGILPEMITVKRASF
jgi:hypothetical protein